MCVVPALLSLWINGKIEKLKINLFDHFAHPMTLSLIKLSIYYLYHVSDTHTKLQTLCTDRYGEKHNLKNLPPFFIIDL